MDTRSKLGITFFSCIGLLMTMSALDQCMFRPREPIHTLSDPRFLEDERQRIVASTQEFGKWHDQRVIHRSRLIVSGNFASDTAGKQPVDVLMSALVRNGWQPDPRPSRHALASLCKGRYRANLSAIGSPALISLTLMVKELQSDIDCLNQ